MSESSSLRLVPLSSSARGTDVQICSPPNEACKFGTVVRALWPVKPALNLAQRIGCSERAANFYIKGKRDPSLGAILVIVDEIRGRRRV
jgi:hypothetical protein